MDKLKKYLIAITCGLLLTCWVLYIKDIFAQTELTMIFHILTDAFFVPGILIVCAGGLVFVSNEGAFDGVTFAMTSFFDVFRKKKKNKFTTYYDYKQSKGDRDRSFGFLLITGSVFLAISGIMLLLYTYC